MGSWDSPIASLMMALLWCAAVPLTLSSCKGALDPVDSPIQDDDDVVVGDDDDDDDDVQDDDDDTTEGPCEPNPYGPIEVMAHCTEGELSDVQLPLEAGSPALRYMGVYQVVSSHDENLMDLEVHLDADHPTVLALNGYHPIRWVVTEAVPGTVQEIIINGGYQPQVSAPAGVPVTIYSSDQGDRLWSSAYDWFDHDTREVIPSLESLTGLQLTSFHGCNESAFFTLTETCEPDTEDPRPDCSQAGEPFKDPDMSLLDGICADIQSEDYWCLTNAGFEAQLFGLESGDLCAINPGVQLQGAYTTSIAWMGEYIYGCTGPYDTLEEVSLVDGQAEQSLAYCQAVASYEGGLLTEEDGKLQHGTDRMWYFETFLDAQCQTGQEWYLDGSKSRMTIYEDTLYYAWHSTNVIEGTDILTGDPIDDIYVEDYDTWVQGMAVIDGELLVLNATWPEERVVVFDVDTGLELWEIPMETRINGLICFGS